MRIYGKTVAYHTIDGWKKDCTGYLPKNIDMYEIEYTDYREDGTVCGKGTEDFSKDRLKNLTYKRYDVKEDSGERTKTGLVKWDLVKRLVVRVDNANSRKTRKLFETIYNDCKLFNI